MSAKVLRLIEAEPTLKVLSLKNLKIKLKGKAPVADIEAWYRARDSRQVSKPVEKRKTVYHISAGAREFQVDVVNFNTPVATTGEFLILIEIRSRKLFAWPISNHTMGTITPIITQFIADHGPIETITGDAFFSANTFVDLCESHKIDLYTHTAKDDHISKAGNKLGVIDRATRTFKELLKRYLDEITKDKRRKSATDFNDIVQNTLTIYNTTPHGSLEDLTPEEVYEDPELTDHLNEEIEDHNEETFSRIKIRDDDYVRVLLSKGVFDKARARYSTELYIVLGRNKFQFDIQNILNDEVLTKKPNELQVVPPETAEAYLDRGLPTTRPRPPPQQPTPNTPGAIAASIKARRNPT